MQHAPPCARPQTLPQQVTPRAAAVHCTLGLRLDHMFRRLCFFCLCCVLWPALIHGGQYYVNVKLTSSKYKLNSEQRFLINFKKSSGESKCTPASAMNGCARKRGGWGQGANDAIVSTICLAAPPRCFLWVRSHTHRLRLIRCTARRVHDEITWRFKCSLNCLCARLCVCMCVCVRVRVAVWLCPIRSLGGRVRVRERGVV